MLPITRSAKTKTREYAGENKKSMNLSEVRMWMILKSSPYNFRRQQTIDNFIVDFASLSHHLIIEIDGITHENKESYDIWREKCIQSHQYKILKFVGMMPYPNAEIVDFFWSKISELESSEQSMTVVEIE